MLPFLLAALVVAALLWLQQVRSRVLATATGHHAVVDASAEQYPPPERATYEAWSSALEGLGFQKVHEYAPTAADGSVTPLLGRLFLHPEERTYAVVAPIVTVERVGRGVMCNVLTFFDDDWLLATGNSQPNPGALFGRNPRTIWQALPHEPPAALLEAHRQWRPQISADLGVQPLPVSRDAFHAHQTALAQRRALYMRQGSFVLSACLYYKRRFFPVLASKGEWPAVAKQRSRVA